MSQTGDAKKPNLEDHWRIASPHAEHLAAAKLALVAVHRVVALDLREEARVAEPHAVAHGRPEHRCVVAPCHAHRCTGSLGRGLVAEASAHHALHHLWQAVWCRRPVGE